VGEPRFEDLLERLERERLAADRSYNDALTLVDRAIVAAPALPAPPAGFDASRLSDANRHWNILPAGPPPIDGSFKGRLRGFIWRLIGPPIQTQQQFNAALIDHLNRNAAASEEAPRALARLLEAVRREFDALARFQSLLVQYLQTITVYVDSKDRSLGVTELRERLALAEQRVAALKRDIEAARSGAPGDRAAESNEPAPGDPFARRVDSLTYVEFEDRFRGSRGDISARVEAYLPVFESASDVVDLGCGRGELLSLLKSRGVKARGVDTNQGMVDRCREQGLEVEQADALTFLRRQPDASIGGLVAVQVVEHFEPGYLIGVLDAAHRAMRPGAPLVLETINPACWMAFFETYIRDPTHVRPLHPETLRYLVQASGFSSVDVQYRQPVREGDRLAHAALGPDGGEAATRLATAVNDHADKLNARLFSSMDYAVVARR
jgi:O-antigen chain-terminating methyltransferase